MKPVITYSFVIPHHNTPDLLQRLVDSIPQREDIEIIVVDDNSDEGKKANVSRSDVRTIYIDKEHSKGAGRARNIGMDAATGKWLLFADADDFYKPEFIKVLDEYKDDDIEVLFFYVDFVDSDTLVPIYDDKRAKSSDTVRQYDGTKDSKDILMYLGWTPWHKMQRRSFVMDHGFRFEEVPKGNDVFFSMQMGYFMKKWKVDKRSLYSVSYTRNSITFGSEFSYLYKFTIANFRKRAIFFKFIGHPEWNKESFRGRHKQSVFLYILRVLKHRPIIGLRASIYYAVNCISIEKDANKYVRIIKDIEKKQKDNR